MSRFFAVGSSSSSSYSSSSDGSDSETETSLSANKFMKTGATGPLVNAASAAASKYAASSSQPISRYLASEDEDDDNYRRVVKSHSEKQQEELAALAKDIGAACDFEDWVRVSAEFEKMLKLVKKIGHKEERSQGEHVYQAPKLYIKSIFDIDTLLEASQDAEAKKKMNAIHARAMNSMRQKLKKMISADESLEKDLAYFKAHAEEENVSEGEVSEAEEPAEPEVKLPSLPTVTAASKYGKKSAAASSSSDDDSDEDSDEDSSSASDDSDVDRDYQQKTVTTAADRWKRKDTGAASKASAKDAAAAKETRKATKASHKRASSDSGSDDEADEALRAAEGKLQFREARLDITPQNVMRKLREVMAARGRKNTDQDELVATLRHLLDAAVSPAHQLRILFGILSAQFDYTILNGAPLSQDLWRSVTGDAARVLDLLETYPLAYFYMDAEADAALEDKLALASLTAQKDDPLTQTAEYVHSSLAFALRRLDDEFSAILLSYDHMSQEYVERLKEETGLFGLLLRGRAYFAASDLAALRQTLSLTATSIVTSAYPATLPKTAQASFGQVTLVAHPAHEAAFVARLLEHLFPKPEAVIAALFAGLPANLSANVLGRDLLPKADNAPAAAVYALATFIYGASTTTDRARTRAILGHVHHLALHDRYAAARSLFLMSHLQENVHQADPLTQIQYNHVMVQLGLAAFRAGQPRETVHALQDLFQTGKVRELLGQGQTSFRSDRYERDAPEDKLPSIPLHLHQSVELAESAFLTASLLTELAFTRHPQFTPMNSGNSATLIPKRASHVLNKQFRRHVETSARMLFHGPPETSRDMIMAATRHCVTGDWQACVALLTGMPIWKALFVGSVSSAESSETPLTAFLATLTRLIKEECLHAYLVGNQMSFLALQLTTLSAHFDLSVQEVKRVVYRLLSRDELPFAYVQESLDADADMLVFGPVQDATATTTTTTNKLYFTALQLADRVTALLEENDRLVQMALDLNLVDAAAVEAPAALSPILEDGMEALQLDDERRASQQQQQQYGSALPPPPPGMQRGAPGLAPPAAVPVHANAPPGYRAH